MGSFPLPEFYNPENASKWSHRADASKLFLAAQDWRKRYHLSGRDRGDFDVELLLIDVQRDFCFPEGSLFVGGRSGSGATEDNRRLAEFMYRNISHIDDVMATQDSHIPFQIFFPSFWIDQNGEPIKPFTTITAETIKSGEARPNPDMAGMHLGQQEDMQKWAIKYCQQLEKNGKYKLCIWPFHCLKGSEGHAFAGVIEEAMLFHALVKSCQTEYLPKGDHPLTESYSVFRPEVDRNKVPDWRNFISIPPVGGVTIIAGQASSHCVKSSIDDIATQIQEQPKELWKADFNSIYILTDCMSAVTVPDGKGGFVADYTAEAEAAQARWAELGMHLVKSTDPMESWPDMKRILRNHR